MKLKKLTSLLLSFGLLATTIIKETAYEGGYML